MTLVGWLADEPGYVGGAELTQAEFRAQAPEGVLVVDCPPGDVVDGLDAYVIHNCVSYEPSELYRDVRPTKYWHDVGLHLSHGQWSALGDDECRIVCASPLQRYKMGIKDKDAFVIPPPINLEPFRKAAENAGERSGAVAVGPWMNPSKDPDAAAQWARKNNERITFYGGGPFAPPRAIPIAPEEMPETLARYKTFVHLPREIEPFGRSVAEAWAAGCEIVVNRLVGARHWITNEPAKLDTAAQDFWNLILERD